jgi:hypothetical protein
MRRYYVDFSTWEICAEDENAAEKKVYTLLKLGKVPLITSVDDTEDEEAELIEQDDLTPHINASGIL